MKCYFFTSLFFDLLYQKEYQRQYFLDIKQKKRPTRQLQPEKGEFLASFQNNNQIVFVLFTYLLFYLMYQKGNQRQYFLDIK